MAEGGKAAAVDDDDEIEAVYEVEGRIDALEDRVYDDELVGRKIKAQYNDEGWSTGTVTWFNTRLGEFRTEFEDGSEDYIKRDEIDGVEIILLPPDPEDEKAKEDKAKAKDEL